ncbi:MAG: PEGA domain-containing protein [Deltaproteobacteria bacterium]|nr:PEGA domain-containing protein [Deltaproteobacteria bacterium]
MGDIELTREEELSGFRVRSRVGRGPRGSIWSAIDPLTGDKAAIKVISVENISEDKLPDHLSAWLETWAALRVTGLSPLKGAAHLSGPYVYIMRDFASGRSLRELARDGVTVSQALDLVARAARIIAAAHRANLVHGNLTLDNVFVAPASAGQEGVALTITDAGVTSLAPLADDQSTHSANDDLIALAQLAHELIYRQPANPTTPRFDPLGALLARAWTETEEGFRDVVAFADALDALREATPDGRDRLVHPEEPEETEDPQETNGTDATSVDATSLVRPSQALLPAPPALQALPKTPPPRRAPGTITRLTHVALGIALCVVALTVTYRVLLDRWPGQDTPTAIHEATLEILTHPETAQVSLDGHIVARRTPIKLHIRRGRPLRLTLTHAGYRTWTQTIALAPNEPQRRIEVQMSPLAIRWGTLKLSTNVQANIFLDSRCVGTQTREVILAEVRAGVDHHLRISAPGHRDLKRHIRIPAGKVQVLDFRLTPQAIASLPLPIGHKLAR